MARFADILADVAARTGDIDASAVRVNMTGWNAWYASNGRLSDARPERPGAAYLDTKLDMELDDPQDPMPERGSRPDHRHPNRVDPPINLAAELDAQRLLVLPLSELRALRRRLARRVHPDVLRTAEYGRDAMARVNIAIDAAIRSRKPLR